MRSWNGPALDANILGINNRDLRDLSTDLATTKRLAPAKSAERVIVSESGIYTHAQVRDLAQYANAFLVGSSLMAQADVDIALPRAYLRRDQGLRPDQGGGCPTGGCRRAPAMAV